MATRTVHRSSASYTWIERLDRRIWPLLVSVAFVVLGSAYVFWWAPVVSHEQYWWNFPFDLGFTYQVASLAVHGHFAAIYKESAGEFVSFPGILVALAPFGALDRSFGVELIQIKHNYRALAHPRFGVVHLYASDPGVISTHGNTYIVHPQWVLFVLPYTLILACLAFFACDALAERLNVSRSRRRVLTVVEAILLWNVAVIWGHPEDAVAVALAVYALITAMDGRFSTAGWLFGAAVAFQPLVLLVLPLIVFMAGWPRAVGVVVRSAVPALALLIAPLLASFHTAWHALVDQPNYPNLDHATPWTTLAPSLGGRGRDLTVASGPGRAVAVLLAIALAAWAGRRWLTRPDLLVWACALALALRVYTESVLDPYYAWPALALGVLLAARGTSVRFVVAAGLAIGTTVVAQRHLGEFPWWSLDVIGVTGVLVAAWPSNGQVRSPAEVETGLGRVGSLLSEIFVPQMAVATTPGGGSAVAKRKRRKTARNSRKRSGRR